MRARNSAAVVASVAVVMGVAAGCGGGSSGGQAAPPATTPAATATATTSSAPPNGIDALPAAAAFRRVLAATATEPSVHIAGSASMHGNTVTLDVDAGTDSGEGRISLGQGTLDVRYVGGKVYGKGTAAGLRSTGVKRSLANALAGKWFGISGASGAGIIKFLSISQALTGLLTHHGHLTTGQATTIDGTAAYSLIDTGKSGGTLYVAATGPPLPLQLVSAAGKHGSIAFTKWGETLSVAKPKHAFPG